MNKKTSLFILFFSLSSFGQQLDEDFLKSLPSNLQKDFRDQVDVLDGEEDKNYASPDTKFNKLESELREAELSLKRLRLEIDKKDGRTSDSLPRFGMNFFTSLQTSFMPINEPNLDPSYILDVGDQLNLQFVGQKNKVHKLLVLRDGTINIPDVGVMNVAGLRFNQAVDLIQSFVQDNILGVTSYISLSALRDMNVLIIGQVNNPGMYTLSGGSNPISLILAAGGINELGSFRNIHHKRNNELLQVIDLYEILIKGNTSFKHQMRSGDVVLVNPKGNEVKITGGVTVEAIYELNENDTLKEALNYAGKVDEHSNQPISIQRLQDDKLTILNIARNFQSNIPLYDGDSIKVPFVLPDFNEIKRVKISGQIRAPGSYTVSDNTKLSEVIIRAGSYTDNAYPVGGVILRKQVKALETKYKDLGYNQLLRYLVASPSFSRIISAPSSSSGILTFLSLLKDYEPSGRVITEFELSELASNPDLDLILQDGDEIHIPSFSREIYVFGEVMNPGGIAYEPLKSPAEYIVDAGSLSKVADSSRIIIIDPSGKSTILRNSLFNLMNNNAQIIPGTVIYVPREMEALDGVNLASAVAPIISSFALSIASLNSINN